MIIDNKQRGADLITAAARKTGLKSKAANIEDWNGSDQIFTGGETQLFNPNAKLSNVGIIE